jgi:ABC-2 type transport system permease protein
MNALIGQLKAELKRTLRNRRYMMFTMIMPLAFYLIFVSQVGGNTKIDGANWSAYYMMSMASFGVIGGSLNTLGVNLANERIQGWVRLLKTTPMPGWVYLVSKMASQLLLNLGVILLLFLVGHFVEHVDLTGGQWLGAGLWVWLSSLAFMAIGVFIGTVAGAQAAQVLATGVQLVFSMLGGLWTPVAAMPSWMKEVANYLPTYHMGHGPWEIVSGRVPAWTDFTNLAVYLIVFMLLSVWVNKKQEAVSA